MKSGNTAGKQDRTLKTHTAEQIAVIILSGRMVALGLLFQNPNSKQCGTLGNAFREKPKKPAWKWLDFVYLILSAMVFVKLAIVREWLPVPTCCVSALPADLHHCGGMWFSS